MEMKNSNIIYALIAEHTLKKKKKKKKEKEAKGKARCHPECSLTNVRLEMVDTGNYRLGK